ncbi:MAG: flavin reductase [Bacteroidetes bacterium]|nr:flavin reductase [Bacteroidota bacterium]
MINFEALFKVTYGLYIVSSGDKTRANGFISNTVFQVTSEPPAFAACCNKLNFTTEFIQKQGLFSISVLGKDTPTEIFTNFGYKSGREIDKMAGMDIRYGESGLPIVLNSSIAFLECKVMQTIDLGTHLLFIGMLLHADLLDVTKDPMTYQYYREVKKGFSPKNAPTYIDKEKLLTNVKDASLKQYKCPVCGYIYDEADETKRFKDLADDWLCPLCGCEKEEFFEIK